MATRTRTIDQEIKQTRPFASIQEQVVVNLLRTCRHVDEHWVQFLRRSEGISLSQYNILRILRGAHPGAIKISDIADRMIYRDPDVTRLVDRLSRQGLARRDRDTEDRRVVLVQITESGLAMLERLEGPVDRYTRSAMAGLSPDQLRTLDTLLNEIRAGMRPFP